MATIGAVALRVDLLAAALEEHRRPQRRAEEAAGAEKEAADLLIAPEPGRDAGVGAPPEQVPALEVRGEAEASIAHIGRHHVVGEREAVAEAVTRTLEQSDSRVHELRRGLGAAVPEGAASATGSQLDLHAAIRAAVVEQAPRQAHSLRIDGRAWCQRDGPRHERLARIAALHDDVPQDGTRPGVHGDPQIHPRGGLADDGVHGGARREEAGLPKAAVDPAQGVCDVGGAVRHPRRDPERLAQFALRQGIGVLEDDRADDERCPFAHVDAHDGRALADLPAARHPPARPGSLRRDTRTAWHARTTADRSRRPACRPPAPPRAGASRRCPRCRRTRSRLGSVGPGSTTTVSVLTVPSASATDGRGNRGVEMPAAGEMVANERRRVALQEGVEQRARPAVDDAGAHVLGQHRAANVQARLGPALDAVLERHAVRGVRQSPCANPRLVVAARVIQLLQPVAVALPGRELEPIALRVSRSRRRRSGSGKPGVPAIRTSVTRGPGGRGGRAVRDAPKRGSCRNS